MNLSPAPIGAKRRVVALLGALLLLAQTPATALGDHGGREIGSFLPCDRPVTPPRCTSVGNNRLHYVAFDASLTEGLASSLRDTMAEDYGATQLIPIEQGRVTAATDVIAYSADYGDNGAAGWVYCPADAPQGINPAGHRWCRHQEMHFNLNPRYGIFFNDDESRDHVTCHELGHTIGLRHWGNPPQSEGPAAATCMNANTPNGPTGLHEYDVDHIDAYRFRVSPPRRMRPLADAGTGMVAATQVDAPATLADLVATSDAIVVGRVSAVEPGRTFGAGDHELHYAAATVDVLEQVAGAPLMTASVTLEVPLFAGLEALQAVRGDLLGSTRLLFLRNKGESARAAGMSLAEQDAESAYHRLVTFGSEVVERQGIATVPPDESRVLDELAGVTFDEAIGAVRVLARRQTG